MQNYDRINKVTTTALDHEIIVDVSGHQHRFFIGGAKTARFINISEGGLYYLQVDQEILVIEYGDLVHNHNFTGKFVGYGNNKLFFQDGNCVYALDTEFNDLGSMSTQQTLLDVDSRGLLWSKNGVFTIVYWNGAEKDISNSAENFYRLLVRSISSRRK